MMHYFHKALTFLHNLTKKIEDPAPFFYVSRIRIGFFMSVGSGSAFLRQQDPDPSNIDPDPQHWLRG